MWSPCRGAPVKHHADICALLVLSTKTSSGSRVFPGQFEWIERGFCTNADLLTRREGQQSGQLPLSHKTQFTVPTTVSSMPLCHKRHIIHVCELESYSWDIWNLNMIINLNLQFFSCCIQEIMACWVFNHTCKGKRSKIEEPNYAIFLKKMGENKAYVCHVFNKWFLYSLLWIYRNYQTKHFT